VLVVVAGVLAILFISRPFTVMWTFAGTDGAVTETLMSPPDSMAGLTVIAIGEDEDVVLDPLEEPVAFDPLEEPVVFDPLEEPVVLVSLGAGAAQPASRDQHVISAVIVTITELCRRAAKA
jgi:hypothetical protein